LGVTTLPDELNHVFRNITEYRFANEDNVIKEIKHQKKHYLIKIAGAGHYQRICKPEDFNGVASENGQNSTLRVRE